MAINGWVLAFTLGAGVLTGVVTEMVPSLQVSREGAALALRTGGHSIAGARGPQRLRGALVSMEVALSLVLRPSRPGGRHAVGFLAYGHFRVFPDAGAPHREGTGRSRP